MTHEGNSSMDSSLRHQTLPKPKSRKKLNVCLVLSCLLCMTAVNGMNTDKFDPCAGNSAMYCQCEYSLNYTEVTNAECGVYNKISNEWVVIEGMVNLQHLVITVRHTSLRGFIPSRVFQRMSKLTIFTLKHGQVERIPTNAFARSSSLQDIILEGNDIAFLDKQAFFTLESLHTLNLRDNQILEVNRSVFGNLPKLKYLYLDQNHIRVIHDRAFVDLVGLEELDLKRNNLTVIARDAFSNLVSLKRLDLHENSIEFLGDHVFADMPMLEDLELMRNRIIHVMPNAFAGLKKLTRLSLKENKIVNLKHHTFAFMHNIYFLDLRQNALETLEEKLVDPIYNNLKAAGTQLLIDGNRFICDCRILWIQDLYNETESGYIRYNLKDIDCDFFHRSSHPNRNIKGHSGHNYEHSTTGSLSYVSNVTMVAVAAEETTALEGFDSSRKVLQLNPEELGCQEDKVTTVGVVMTPSSPTTSSSVLHPAPSSTDTVATKQKKHKNHHEHEVLADTPDLNPSQSSRSSAAGPPRSSGAPSRIKADLQNYVTWLMAVTVFLIPLSLST